MDLRHILHKFGGSGVHEGRSLCGVRKDSGVTAIEYHERTLASHTMNSVVMGEFSKQEPIAPVGLSVVNEDLEILLNFLVNLFSLTIRLRMKGSRGIQSDVKEAIELFHEFGDKLRATIRDHSHRHAMSCIDMVSKNSSPSFSREFSITGNRNDGF